MSFQCGLRSGRNVLGFLQPMELDGIYYLLEYFSHVYDLPPSLVYIFLFHLLYEYVRLDFAA